MTSAEPSERLPRAARTYWRVQLLAAGVGAVVLAAGAVGLWAVVVGLAAVVAAVVVPEVRWRRWRYEIRDEEIDLQSGLFTVRRTLVPIRRVQHVDTETGPVQGWFDLAAVTFHTAAGKTRIPALRRADAETVRRRVAELARTRDDV